MSSTISVPDAAETPELPVTVSFTRRADPAHAVEMTAWIRAGLTMAEGFPGFLGAGWVRPQRGADEWHMLYRFSSQAAGRLGGQPRTPLVAGVGPGAGGESRTERRTGIEGWFDAPDEAATETAGRSARAAAVEAGGDDLDGLLPAEPAGHRDAGPAAGRHDVVLRVAVTTLTLTPIMTYLLLPWITRRLHRWLRPTG